MLQQPQFDCDFGKPVFFSLLWKAEEAASEGSRDGGSSSNGVDALTSKGWQVKSTTFHLGFFIAEMLLEGAIHSWGAVCHG